LTLAGHVMARLVQVARTQRHGRKMAACLWLSPDHAVHVKDVLFPIKHLIDDLTIQRVPVDEVIFYHIELDRQDVLPAEGLPAESCLDTGDRSTNTSACI
jgi:Hint domain